MSFDQNESLQFDMFAELSQEELQSVEGGYANLVHEWFWL